MWHCPHCGAPQAETARCWVCRRSSTTCSTCRHFRASLATDIGYCALDRTRRPLTGRELRGCWTQPKAAVASPSLPGQALEHPGIFLSVRDFVPVEGLGNRHEPLLGPNAVSSPPLAAVPIDGWESRTNLFGDPER